MTKRKDKNRIVLKTGESYRESENRYSYRWTDRQGKRHTTYAKTLEALRKRELDISKSVADGIKIETDNVTLNDIYKLWQDTKRGLKNTTFQNYCYMYETFTKDTLGKQRIKTIKKTDIKRYYNNLSESRGLKPNTIDCIHTVLHQLFDVAIDDGYLSINPSTNALKELKRATRIDEKRSALTADQEKLFLAYTRSSKQYSHWYPLFAVMVGTGVRVGELTGLRWCDVNFEDGYLDINHTLVYYAHRIAKPGEKVGCYFAINSTKTPASKRQIPMLDYVREALSEQRNELPCSASVDGYSGFVFANRFGGLLYQGTLNKALHRIIRDCNLEQIEKGSDLLLPNFSCHSLRHTFATRMCENGINLKVIQDVMGHTDISTTMNIYTDATRDMKCHAFEKLNKLVPIDTNSDAKWCQNYGE